jgi:hypothetical protein
LLRIQAAGSTQRSIEAFEQAFIGERFAQKPNGSAFKRSLSGALRKKSSDENNGQSLPIFDQALLQVKARQSGHL